MADITKNLLKVNDGATVTKEAGSASFTIDLEGRGDENYAVIVENTDGANACRVTFKAGVGMSATQGDLEVDIAISSLAGVGYFESARFINVDGKIDVEVLDQDDGAFTGTEADVKFIVVELPKQLVFA